MRDVGWLPSSSMESHLHNETSIGPTEMAISSEGIAILRLLPGKKRMGRRTFKPSRMRSLVWTIFVTLALLPLLTGCEDQAARYREIEDELVRVNGSFYDHEKEVVYDLVRCDVTPLFWERVFPLDKLGSVHLAGSNFSDAHARFLLHCPKLMHVDCSYTEITDGGVSQLQNIPRLEFLDLSGCRVTDGCIPDLLAHKSLREVNLLETPISKEGARQLAKRFQITWSDVPSEEVRQGLSALARRDVWLTPAPKDQTIEGHEPNQYDIRLWPFDLENASGPRDQVVEHIHMLSHAGQLKIQFNSSALFKHLPAISRIDDLEVRQPWETDEEFDLKQLKYLAGVTIHKLTLYVEDTPADQFAAVASIKKLRELDISNQTITPDKWSALMHCRELKSIHFIGCQFNQLGLYEGAEHAIQIHFDLFEPPPPETRNKLLELTQAAATDQQP